MKLKGANLLELSLAIAFSLVVFSITLQLIQESTDRINKGFEFQTFQERSFQTLLRIQQLSDWNWGTEQAPWPYIKSSIVNQSSIQIDNYILTNNQWVNTTSDAEIKNIRIEHPKFNNELSIFISNAATIKQLKGCLATIKIGLDMYHEINQFYPPNHQLNYLTQSNILTNLPNNPYTIEDLSESNNKNMTDWHYTNINGSITLYAYTHPNIQLQF